jgi:hypothetical protein
MDWPQDRFYPDGRRRIQLTQSERDTLVHQEMVERAIALYLDLTTHRTTRQIAEELGITRSQLKELTNEQAFIEKYQEHFTELGHDPRLSAVREGIADLLPVAFETLATMLESPDTPEGIRAKLVMKVLELNGIKPVAPKGSDKRELAEFLKDAGATVNLTKIDQMNVNVPQAYEADMAETVEGVCHEPQSLNAPAEISGAGNSTPQQPGDAPAPPSTASGPPSTD